MLLLRHRLSAIYIVEHGTYHIGINGKLLLQCFDAVETVFVAHAAVKAEFEMVAVKVAAVIVEQVASMVWSLPLSSVGRQPMLTMAL